MQAAAERDANRCLRDRSPYVGRDRCLFRNLVA